MDDIMAMPSSDSEKNLEYRVYKCSSFTTPFVPENILVDKPSDQNSRWSTDNDNYPQYMTLKLQEPAIVKRITFGKFEKTHVCNVKKFQVYGGINPESMLKLAEGGQRNDAIPETFELKCTIGANKHYFPVRYVKIVVLQSWGPNMNCSMWHVKLTGINDHNLVKIGLDWLQEYQKREVIRLCIKHFRKYQQQEIVDTLERVTGTLVEDPQLSVLYDLLVVKGNHIKAEEFIANAICTGLLDEYINDQLYQVVWQKISIPDLKPGMRGGHQMVLDPSTEILYLFGGWNGNQDLADLWAYDINTSTWTLICSDTSAVGGPSARSCHKMCLDPERRQIFLLGRYLDTQFRTTENLKSDFFVYDIGCDKWTQISEDTAAVGGPELIFDHQMLMDIEKRTIYIFGGRILIPPMTQEENTLSTGDLNFSGLFSYHVPTGTWQKLAHDIGRPNIQNLPSIKSRVGHSMLFNPASRKLYIFAGQRGKDYLNDFFTYEVDTNKVENINLNELSTKDTSHIPAAGFTQRATIDPELGEIYVLSGLSKDKDKRDENVQNSLWVYNIKSNKWVCIYKNENLGEKYWAKRQNFEPCPRFAHQLVYNPVKKVHYLFGGNPGRSCVPKLRLDDFWQLELRRPSHEQILDKCKLIIRKYKFAELAVVDTFEALDYLQTQVAEIIDHKDEQQIKELHMLTSLLFCNQFGHKELSDEDDEISKFCELGLNEKDKRQRIHSRRTELYDKLSEFFPESLTQPRVNLTDILPL
ncbi:muskelin [Copidosoma floridanum]|uniref:muskelin n=1 Tax=Copidosoma floridanum TaxID=29053 RepID=UPI0006C9BF17|nr:muskelin [Copidosoma floridanum]